MSQQESDFDDESVEELVDENYIGQYVGERLDDDGRRDGFGRAILPNRDQYEGEYRKGLRNGSGCYWYKNGGQYNGEWKKGLMDGHGKLIYPDGSHYCGSWKQGNKHGYGVYTYRNGDIYDGSWKNNIRHGTGMYKCQEANISFKATWVDGIPKGPIEICYPNFKYHGYWNKTHPVGKGVFTFGTKYMLPGHIEMFKNPQYVDSARPSEETFDTVSQQQQQQQQQQPQAEEELLRTNNEEETVKSNNQDLTNVKFPKCLPYFVAHEITQYNYSQLPQHPIPPPQSDSETSICTKSSTSTTDEVHLYQVQSPMLVAADSIQFFNEDEDTVDIHIDTENEINFADASDTKMHEGNE